MLLFQELYTSYRSPCSMRSRDWIERRREGGGNRNTLADFDAFFPFPFFSLRQLLHLRLSSPRWSHLLVEWRMRDPQPSLGQHNSLHLQHDLPFDRHSLLLHPLPYHLPQRFQLHAMQRIQLQGSSVADPRIPYWNGGVSGSFPRPSSPRLGSSRLPLLRGRADALSAHLWLGFPAF